MKYEELTTVDLELTSNCQAGCPQCIRNIRGDIPNPFLPIRDLTLESVQLIFTPEVLMHLKAIRVGGNFGDAVVNRECLEIFKHFRSHNENIHLTFHTNGSARSTKWWHELGLTIGVNGLVKFGIDGLEDTHHLYRRHTDFNKIIENAKAFIDAGGEAHWEFIVFKHNEHQVDQCRAMAASLGFKSFTAKKTPRFFLTGVNKHVPRQPVFDKNKAIEYYLEEPTDKKYQNQAISFIRDLPPSKLDKHYDETPIDCKAIKSKSVYIDFDGVVYPCCWVGAQPYSLVNMFESNQFLDGAVPTDFRDRFNARQGLKTVLDDTELWSLFKNSWEKKSIDDGKFKICSRICGTIDPFQAMFKKESS